MYPLLEDIQDQIVNSLSDEFPELEVRDWPEDPDNYNLTHPKGAILVIMSDRQFQDPEASDRTDQHNNIDFQISSMTRSLRKGKDNPSAYPIMEQIRTKLQAQFFGPDRGWPRRERLISVKGGVYHYAQIFRIPHYHITE